MVSVNIREFTHNFSGFLKKVKSGKRIVLMERNVPIADIVPHNENIRPGWKRKINKIKIGGEPLSTTIVKNRRDEKK